MQSRRLPAVLLIILVLGVSAVAFSEFSSTLNISGTVAASGSFNVSFIGSGTSKTVALTSVSVPDGVTAAAAITDPAASGSESEWLGDSLALTIKNFSAEGQRATYRIPVKNSGTVPAEISATSRSAGVLKNGSPSSDITLTFTPATVDAGQTGYITVTATCVTFKGGTVYTTNSLGLTYNQPTVAALTPGKHSHS